MRYLLFSILFLTIFTANCAAPISSFQQNSATGIISNASPKPTFDQAAIEKLNQNLPEDVRQILEQAEMFEIISARGLGYSKEKNVGEVIKMGRQWQFAVASKTQINDSTVKNKLLDALYDTIIQAPPNSRAMCFYPRHALRAMKQGKIVELVICFSCNAFEGNTPNGRVGGVVTKQQREIFDEIFKSAGLEIQP